MSLKHETARYSRKSRPNDASETSKADQMMPQKHHLDGYVKGLSRGSRGSVTRKRVEIAVEHLEFFCHHDHFLEGFLKLVSKEMLHKHS